MLLGILHQLLGYHIQNGKAVLYNGTQLAFKPVRNHLRQVFAVNLFCTAPCNLLELFFGSVDMWPECAFGYRADVFNHIRDAAGVFDNHLIRLFGSEIFKLLQHLIGCPKIQRGLVIRVLISLPRH